MKTVIKLIIAAALINAVARGAWAQWNYYQLKDGAQQLLTFDVDASPDQLESAILEKATELDIPVEPDDVAVKRDGLRSRATVSYTQPIEFFPKYVYPMKYSFAVDTLAIRAGNTGGVRQH
jgi:hypothetical protein